MASDVPEFRELISGDLSLTITRDPEIIKEGQALRYRVFYEEMGGRPAGATAARPIGLDKDEFDDYCDHLLVHDHSGDKPRVIGTYRLLRGSEKEKLGRFYTEGEFDISNLFSGDGEVAEVGRSCVDPAYRTGAVMKLLWRGIAAYLEHYNIRLLFGCASFHGTDPETHRLGLSYLHHYHLAPQPICPKALPHIQAEYKLLPKEEINEKRAFASLPPLIKGYLRLGGVIGEGAIIDPECNTVDVCIIVNRDLIDQRYVDHFTSPLDPKPTMLS